MGAVISRIDNKQKILRMSDKNNILRISDIMESAPVNPLLLQTPAQLPQHLKSLRKLRGLTQAKLAARLRIKQARYAYIESHPETVATGQILDVLAALGVDVQLRVRPNRVSDEASEDW